MRGEGLEREERAERVTQAELLIGGDPVTVA
jgi:hypothetical protein